MSTNTLQSLANIILKAAPGLSFSMVEIGALPDPTNPEPFHQLIECFSGSNIIAFELDKSLCDKLNSKSGDGIRYFANAIGKRKRNGRST